MKTEVYKKLKKYEGQLNSALRCGYARLTSPQLNEISDILNEHRGTALTRQERSCSHCLLQTLKRLGEEFYKFKDSPWGKKADNEEENSTEEQ